MFLRKQLSKLVEFFLLEINAIYDYCLFKKYYTKETSKDNDQKELESWILQDKHRIEKAFSLPCPRFGFGEVVIRRLSKNLDLYSSRFQKDNIFYIGVGALKAYKEFHLLNSAELPSFFTDESKKFSQEDLENAQCNQVGYTQPEKITDAEKLEYLNFSMKRKSCRNYDTTKSLTIDDSLINDVLKAAITAPSVCNRQHWHVHFFKNDKKDEILKYQNGNTGFSKNIPMLALVTSDLRSFYSANERNQGYTDGGLFSMNLMYALQAHGLASCPLNWCSSYLNERRFRAHNFIPKNEIVIMAIALGYADDSAVYAKSPRLAVENFYTIN
ncbi:MULTISPECIES: nitroreductase family protein [Pseudoalteromonas]|uniref:nitroreductase family protein n=1 Tax=Pseudoalteromonas TaxID=53246 RepID=UPI000C3232E3|nr:MULTISPECIES: nitroreductase family protein [Pseudoalteromonas]PKG63484.1 hypothetical protein CXF75_14425 [Pseudoalteromonas arctica]PKG68736.1 hypothetical protein CXF64_20670 [Pseudoalteromonas sp. GutCa3]